MGELCRKQGTPYFVPCTAKAILTLLRLAMLHDTKGTDTNAVVNPLANPGANDGIYESECMNISVESFKKWLFGKKIVMLGRSDIVGMPTYLSLLKLDATVSLCHSQSIDTKERLAEADIVIVAIGKPSAIDPRLLKSNSIVIDVGIHYPPSDESIISSSDESIISSLSAVSSVSSVSSKIVGDVDQSDFTSLQKLKYLSPVPGGVGPMTIAMLMDNILLSAERLHNLE